MKAHFEKVPLGSLSVHCFRRDDPTFPLHWHYHPEFELTLIEAGSGQRLVGDSIADYGPGDLVLLGPGLPHSWRSNNAHTPHAKRKVAHATEDRLHRAIVVQFRADFAGADFLALEEMKPLAAMLRRSWAGLAFCDTAVASRVAERLRSLQTVAGSRRLLHLLDVLQDLAEEQHATVLTLGRVRPIVRAADQQRIDLICAYLDRHYRRVDFAALCKATELDQSSLCRFFKRATGRTMTAYVNELRVGAATHLLTSTSLSTLEISLRVGFENYANFGRHFRRLKQRTPNELRREFRQTTR